MTKSNRKNRFYATAIVAFLMFSVIFASVPIASAAGAITLSPIAQAPTGSVTVDGTGFGATKAVGIGFGAEIAVTDEVVTQTGSGFGPYIGTVANRPVKPGTSHFTIEVAGGVVTYEVTDNGDGTLASTSEYFANGTMNYVTGQYVRYATSDPGSYSVVVYAAYTRYAYNVTPVAGVTSGPSGAFSASITVPSVANGAYNVTAMDTAGNMATAPLTVDNTIPEGLTIGVMLLLSAIAVIVSIRYYRKRPKWQSW